MVFFTAIGYNQVKLLELILSFAHFANDRVFSVFSESESSFIIKKTFFFFYPHTLTIRLKRPVYWGFSGEGWCEGVRVKTAHITVTREKAPMALTEGTMHIS